jgi:hypothetical protein
VIPLPAPAASVVAALEARPRALGWVMIAGGAVIIYDTVREMVTARGGGRQRVSTGPGLPGWESA